MVMVLEGLFLYKKIGNFKLLDGKMHEIFRAAEINFLTARN